MNLKDYKQLCKVKGYDIREHQKDFLTNNAFDNSRKPFVLGAGTSSGKGPMSIMWLELFYQNQANKNKTTLFVSASKTILRDNIHGVLKNFKPSFSYSIVKDKKTLIAALERNAQVLVLIPQTIKSYYKLLPKIHTFILDEAHEWYFAKTKGNNQSLVTKILKHIQPTKQLLLTGTPSKFIADGSKFNFQFVPVMDLYDAGLVSNVKMEIVSSTYDFKANDWQGTYGNLKATKTNSPKQAEDALVAVCKEMIDKLKNPLKEWYSINNVTKNSIGKLFDYMDKTIIYTHSLNQANKFHKILNAKKELSGRVLVSHSENDPDSIEFNKFKTEDKYKVLVAVDRGRIGFDMPELFNIVDFTMTQNLDMLLQMYGRLLRKSDLQKKKQKIYFKVSTKNTADYFVDLMTAMLCLTDMKWYSMYNGKNMAGIQIPKVLTKSIRNKQYTNNQSKKKSNKVKPIVSLTELGIPLDLNFFRQSILHSSHGKFNTIAETTLEDVRRECFNISGHNGHTKNILSYDEAKKIVQPLVKKYNIKSYSDWTKFTKTKNMPDNVPVGLIGVYSKTDEWISSDDFFGYKSNFGSNWVDYKGFKQFMLDNNLSNGKDFKDFCKQGKRPKNIPSNPHLIYNEWQGWDFLFKDKIIYSESQIRKEFKDCETRNAAEKKNKDMFNQMSKQLKHKMFGKPKITEPNKIKGWIYDENKLNGKGKYIGIFESFKDAKRKLKKDLNNIRFVVNGTYKQTNGFTFEKIK